MATMTDAERYEDLLQRYRKEQQDNMLLRERMGMLERLITHAYEAVANKARVR